MNEQQKALLAKARESLDVARHIDARGSHGFAASRAYYAIFYVVEALLLGGGLSTAVTRRSSLPLARGSRRQVEFPRASIECCWTQRNAANSATTRSALRSARTWQASR